MEGGGERGGREGKREEEREREFTSFLGCGGQALQNCSRLGKRFTYCSPDHLTEIVPDWHFRWKLMQRQPPAEVLLH